MKLFMANSHVCCDHSPTRIYGWATCCIHHLADGLISPFDGDSDDDSDGPEPIITDFRCFHGPSTHPPTQNRSTHQSLMQCRRVDLHFFFNYEVTWVMHVIGRFRS